MLWRGLLWIGFVCCLMPRLAAADFSVPSPLAPWQEWSLRNHSDIQCPFLYSTFERRQCQWPGTLQLRVTEGGLQFEQQWQLFAKGLVSLPGGDRYWPESVLVNGVEGLVFERGETPVLRLAKGSHHIVGFIPWQRIPESVLLPPNIALIQLTINGAVINRPNVDDDGRLWFASEISTTAKVEAQAEDKLTVRVYRKLTDDIPFVIETRVDLEVSGKSREVTLGKLLFDQFTPRLLNSPLPARVDQGGRLRIQLRPGQWQVRLQAHQNVPVAKVFLETSDEGFWPEEEVWVFEARPALRQVRVEGADSIDPAQTALPEAWRQWPAYHVRQGQALNLVELRRGDPQPSPNQLNVERDLWLDFDGAGITLQDRIRGSMSRGWRVNVDPRLQLGSLSLNGDPQVITISDGLQGVEVRDRQLQAEALSRQTLKQGTHKHKLPAVGWLHDVDSLRATLHLPPGWRVLMATGMERSSNTWLDSWSVWDVFIVLITIAAILRLRGAWAALITGVALVLIYPEATVFLYLLLNVIVVMTLLLLLPAGRLQRVLKFYGGAAALALVLWMLGFMVEQARLGMYPQLQQPWIQMGAQPVSGSPESQRNREMDVSFASMPAAAKASPPSMYSSYGASERLDQHDPGLAAQTGPGLPNWAWQRTFLQWSGPVTSDETVTLWLLEPYENRILSWARVVLTVLLLAALLGLSQIKGRWRWPPTGATFGKLGIMIFALMAMMPVARDAKAEFPDNEMLDELASRQLQEQNCTPACLSIVKSRIDIQSNRVTIRLTLNAQREVYWPLPDSQKQWRVDSVLLDGEPHYARKSATGSAVNSAQLELFVPHGAHQLTLSGTLDSIMPFQLTFGVQPHNLQVVSDDFTVRGLDSGRLLSNTLHFQPVNALRQQIALEEVQLNPDPIAAFVSVERILRLGRNWYMETRVKRVAPEDGGISLDIPLIEGESVTSQDLEVAEGMAKAVLKPGQKQLVWFSALEKTSLLTLQAANTASWAELWQVEVSPLWRMQAEGLAPVKDGTLDGGWRPRWQPYPGESLTLAISRPEALVGATKTIDQVMQEWEPGLRESSGNLRLHVLSSKGAEQRIELPAEARVKSVSVDNELRAVDELNPKLIIPVNPGEHWIEVSWRQPSPSGFKSQSPVVSIEDAYVNHLLQVKVPRNRWVLFVGGPDMGPAILFWGVLIVLVVVGFALGRVEALPLKSTHWILLMVGLCAGWVETIVVVVLWFLLLQQRQAPWVKKLNRTQFNLLQVVIVLFSLVAFALLLAAIPNGLIGSPDMGVVGNGSSQYDLNWFVDRGESVLQSAWFISLPLWVYRAFMLVWSLWLVVSMLRWLKWAWAAFTQDGYWRSGVVLESSTEK